MIALVIVYFGFASYYNVVKFYFSTWGLKLPLYNKKETIINKVGKGGIVYCDILSYDDISKVEKVKGFKIVNEREVDEYFDIVEKHLLYYLNVEEKSKLMNEISKYKLFDISNYFLLLEDTHDGMGYVFSLLILDLKNKNLYAFYSNYDRNRVYLEKYRGKSLD